MGERKDSGCVVFGLIEARAADKVWGTWIDLTVLCTGFNGKHDENDNLSRIGDLENKVKAYSNAVLFVFQYSPPGTVKGISISNCFIRLAKTMKY